MVFSRLYRTGTKYIFFWTVIWIMIYVIRWHFLCCSALLYRDKIHALLDYDMNDDLYFSDISNAVRLYFFVYNITMSFLTYSVTPGDLLFRSVSAAATAAAITAATVSAAAATAVLLTLFNFPGKPPKLLSSNHTWLTCGCGKILAPILGTLCQGH